MQHRNTCFVTHINNYPPNRNTVKYSGLTLVASLADKCKKVREGFKYMSREWVNPVHIYTYIYMYVYMYVCMYVYMCLYIYIYIYRMYSLPPLPAAAVRASEALKRYICMYVCMYGLNRCCYVAMGSCRRCFRVSFVLLPAIRCVLL